ncbi:MAG: heparinase II/III family protein [Candidatus Omnitrophica bacterium]|nr:heparinase II/III family protein [Candidatus Omnitrophota bacterium]
MDRPKAAFPDIQANIEERLFRETLAHPDKIYSNFPRTLISLLTLEAILEGPDNRARILELFAEILTKSLKQDGMTGEKGLTGYSAIFPASFAQVMARFDRAMPGLLEDLFKQFPDLYKTYRFHIDTWCGQEFYPLVGDSGSFGIRDKTYRGVYFQGGPTTEPSMHQFLWRLHEITQDPAFVQASYYVNGNTTRGLPHDLFASDPPGFEKQVQEVIDRAGPEITLSDVNKEEWGLSILRSGKGGNRRAVWLNHGVGGGHHHRDGLNVGYFAKGLDLLPDFGYPPVGYGGWGAPKAVWYTMTAAHHTVTVDGKNHKDGRGKTTLWAPGVGFHAVRVAAPEVISGSRFERTVMMVDIDDEDSYIVDILRVTGGFDHAKFVSSFFGSIETTGLNLMPSEDYGRSTETRNFRTDRNPSRGWSATWTLDDRYGYRPGKPPVHFRYTDLTEGAEASLGEAWVIDGQFDGKEVWIPRLLVRRGADQPPLGSCFVSVLEAFEGTPKVQTIARLPVEGGSGGGVALEVLLADGRRDVMIEDADAGDVALRIPLPHGRGSVTGELAYVREREGKVERMALGNAAEIRYGETEVKLKARASYVELLSEGKAMKAVAGDANVLQSVGIGEREVRPGE